MSENEAADILERYVEQNFSDFNAYFSEHDRMLEAFDMAIDALRRSAKFNEKLAEKKKRDQMAKEALAKLSGLEPSQPSREHVKQILFGERRLNET